jgi:hypothetical protein
LGTGTGISIRTVITGGRKGDDVGSFEKGKGITKGYKKGELFMVFILGG